VIVKILIYDIEIKKAILGKNENPIPGIEYCDGWHDHENMGISCIGAYDYYTERYRVFMDDNKDEFAEAVDAADVIVGFNNMAFDNSVINATWPFSEPGIYLKEKSYDLLVSIWEAAGLGPKFEYPRHIGFGLDACCAANFGARKTGNGALAPVHYQRGEIGKVIDYCLNDVALTKRLLDLVIHSGQILDPRDPSAILNVKGPLGG
jgi:hypothetical protein